MLEANMHTGQYTPAQGIQAIDVTQRYAKAAAPGPPTNCIADVESRQQ